ncbi:MAG TPA: ABC transporter substrate-binding protein [Stellaceae bacterium]
MPCRSPAALVAALVLLAGAAVMLTTGPARSADFTDAAGRRIVLPDPIRRILPAERNAEVLVFVLAPERLVGLSRLPGRGALFPRAGRLPVVDWRPRANPASMAETARRLRPDLIIDAGAVTPERAAFAEQVQQMTGIPYILVDDSFARIPTMLRSVGAILGNGDRAIDLAIFAEHAIAGLRGRLLIRPADTRPHVYYALGPDGLTTALPGSPAGEAIDEAGAINVASGLGRGSETVVSREQLLAWDPTVIIAQDRRFYASVRRDRALRRLSAVRNHRVYLEPRYPFGWIEDPSSINRLIGLYWLSSLFYPDATQEDLRATACDFYDKFYEISLTNGQLEAMVRPAGIPAVETLRPVGEPLIGLGAAPPSTLPAGTPGTPSQAAAAPEVAPGTGPAAKCIVPGGQGPYDIPATNSGTAPGASPDYLPPTIAPGVPPPGRRGRPLGLAPAPAPAQAAEAQAGGGLAYQYQTRP